MGESQPPPNRSPPISSSADSIDSSASPTGYGDYVGGACAFQKTRPRTSRPDGRKTAVSHTCLVWLQEWSGSTNEP